ncbi:toxin YdaT domain-containing protein [Citrobacter koseri]|uniref:toxin YdaT domain-containing protein n=1 Tax=Citrobacter koseri TaxID=545 RepID=UPI0027D14F84|nr:toxin YdaT domain-containing protein [Citrobacter koseri]MDQ2324565.1 toxin YdaT domain-containing protein [Citrobacter koseri]WOI92531.1 toxin YdaT domain-containing protein [Citrobacter koseri]WOJ15794.1 toxin YdaT domain-containing protein [Citrobacter koseri]WOJ22189.1 toxin YdaT domain-containing protein [Citrobacter koseri]
MHSISFQQNTGFPPATMINRNQPDPADKHDQIRAAVRAWSASLDNQDVVAGIIVEEWERQGGAGLDFPGDLSRKRQKLFRWLDSDTGYARENIRQLTPAILAVLPLEFRGRLAPQNDTMSLIASAMKECSEAKQAVLLNAPEHQKLKEVSEGIASLFRLMPEQVGPLMAMVTSMLGVM